jgi:hypothetical protein
MYYGFTWSIPCHHNGETPMSTSTLIRSKGAELVTIDQLAEVKPPPPEGRWFPLAHHAVVCRVKQTLTDAGFEVKKEQLALAKDRARFFGTLDLVSALTPGVTLAVGIRNSVDRSLPIGFCAGSRVLVCENLAFRSELLVKRKHTRNGERHFANDIAGAVHKLEAFRVDEGKRIAAMRIAEVNNDKADSLILNAFEKGIITTPALPKVIECWRNPVHDEFKERTYWSLFNAFTSALGERALANPHAYATLTMRLSGHLTPPMLAIAA